MLRVLVLVGAGVLAGAGLAGDSETSPKLDAHAYHERAGPFTVIISNRLAHISLAEPHLPFLVGVGVDDYESRLLVAAPSFVLRDAAGTVHQMSVFEEVDQQLIRAVHRSAEAWPLSKPGEFNDMERVRTDFYPMGPLPETVVFQLTRHNYVETVIYFPREGIDLDGVLTLQFMARGLSAPMQIRFRMPPAKRP